MICEKCGSENSDNSKYCNECGEKIIFKNEILENDKIDMEEPLYQPTNSLSDLQYTNTKSNEGGQPCLSDNPEDIEANEQFPLQQISLKKKPSKKVIILVVSILGAVGLSLIICFSLLIPYNKYESATQLYNEKNYKTAITDFTELKGYKDSSQMIVKCEYEQGKINLDSYLTPDFESAIQYFTLANNYKDSKTLIKKAKYDLATNYIEEENYSKAIDILTKIDGYSDSKELIIDSTYLMGQAYYDAGDYDNAIKTLTDIKGYKDSQSMINDSYYQEATSDYSAGNFSNAESLFDDIPNYKDSAQNLQNCCGQALL